MIESILSANDTHSSENAVLYSLTSYEDEVLIKLNKNTSDLSFLYLRLKWVTLKCTTIRKPLKGRHKKGQN